MGHPAPHYKYLLVTLLKVLVAKLSPVTSSVEAESSFNLDLSTFGIPSPPQSDDVINVQPIMKITFYQRYRYPYAMEIQMIYSHFS